MHKPGCGHLPVPVWHASYCVPKVVYFVAGAQFLLGYVQAHPLSGGPGKPPYRLEHGIEHSPGKVLLWVRQSLWIVGAGGTAHGQIALALQVRQQRSPLPSRAALDKVAGRRGDQVIVLSDELLLPFGELGSPAHDAPAVPGFC